jgi:8-oxo-dGTP diphosphatase
MGGHARRFCVRNIVVDSAYEDGAMTARRELTHAGGVVYRITRGVPQFLLVTSRRRPREWVFPKGRIELDETPEQTAAREVREESGVSAAIVEPLEDVSSRMDDEDRVVRYFLMRAIRNGSPGEGRRSLWLSPDEALRHLSFSRARTSLRKALRAMIARGLVESGEVEK